MSAMTRPTAPTTVNADDYDDYDAAYRAAKAERVTELPLPYATTADIVSNLVTDYPKPAKGD